MVDKTIYKDKGYSEEASQKYMLARVYIPFQTYRDEFPLDEALKRGTLFPELYRPYVKKG